MKRAAIYLRYSSDRQDDATIETQRAECLKRSKEIGAAVVVEYVDTAMSGRVEDRPEFQRMIRDVKGKPRPWDVLIVRKYDRFARDVTASRVYKTMIRRTGADVISVHEQLDAETASGRLLEVVIEAVAAFFSENLATETKSGMATNTRRGFRSGGFAPYGYRNIRTKDIETGKDRTRIEPDETEAPRVQEIFTMAAAGQGLKAIGKELESRGWPPRWAKSWHPTTIKAILGNPVYVGRQIWRTVDGKTVAEGECPAIVSPEVWDLVQAKAQAPGKASSRSIGTAHPLAGICRCGVCGGSMVIYTKVRGTWRLRCANRPRKQCANTAHPAEPEIIDAVKRCLVETLLTPEALTAALAEYHAELKAQAKESGSGIEETKKRLAKIDRQISRTLDELTLGEVPRELLAPKLAELQQTRAGLSARIVEAESSKRQAEEFSRAPLGDIDEVLRFARARIENAEGADLKAALLCLNVQIEVQPDSLKISTAPLSESRVVLESAGSPRPLDATQVIISHTIIGWRAEKKPMSPWAEKRDVVTTSVNAC